jgi:hypothetical protein
VMPNGITPMGGIFVQWFVYLLVVIGLSAHVASLLPAGTPPR